MSSPGLAGNLRGRVRSLGGEGRGVASVAIAVFGVGLVVVLFFAWNEQCLPYHGQSLCLAEFGVVSGWAGFGIVAGLAAGILVLWEWVSAAGALVLADRANEGRVAALLGLAAVVFTVVRVATRPHGLTPYAWLGLALSICLCVATTARWLGDRLANSQAPG